MFLGCTWQSAGAGTWCVLVVCVVCCVCACVHVCALSALYASKLHVAISRGRLVCAGGVRCVSYAIKKQHISCHIQIHTYMYAHTCTP